MRSASSTTVSRTRPAITPSSRPVLIELELFEFVPVVPPGDGGPVVNDCRLTFSHVIASAPTERLSKKVANPEAEISTLVRPGVTFPSRVPATPSDPELPSIWISADVGSTWTSSVPRIAAKPTSWANPPGAREKLPVAGVAWYPGATTTNWYVANTGRGPR